MIRGYFVSNFSNINNIVLFLQKNVFIVMHKNTCCCNDGKYIDDKDKVGGREYMVCQKKRKKIERYSFKNKNHDK